MFKQNIPGACSRAVAQLGFSLSSFRIWMSVLRHVWNFLHHSLKCLMLWCWAHLCTINIKTLWNTRCSFAAVGHASCPSDRHHKTRFPIFRATWFRKYFARFPQRILVPKCGVSQLTTLRQRAQIQFFSDPGVRVASALSIFIPHTHTQRPSHFIVIAANVSPRRIQTKIWSESALCLCMRCRFIFIGSQCHLY